MGKIDSKKETAQNEARFETILQAHGDAGVLFVQKFGLRPANSLLLKRDSKDHKPYISYIFTVSFPSLAV